jgi:hypothetical protein
VIRFCLLSPVCATIAVAVTTIAAMVNRSVLCGLIFNLLSNFAL